MNQKRIYTARTEVSAMIETHASDAEINAALTSAAIAQGHPEITPDLVLPDAAIEHPVWNIIDAAVLALRPRIAVVFTDQAVLDGEMFDPGSISRFIVEHASDDLRCEVFLVVDHWDKNTRELVAWAREQHLKIAGISLTRNESYSQYNRTIDGIVRRSYERVVVADLYYKSTDPRVATYRRVTR